MLFVGPPGLGKTTLAQIVARELGVNFRATSGPVIAKAGRPRSAPHQSGGPRRPLHRRDPPPRRRRSRRSSIRRWRTTSSTSSSARGRRRARSGSTSSRFTLVGATTRARASDDAAARPLRHSDPPRLLYRGGTGEIVRRGARILGAPITDDGRARDRAPLARHAAHRRPAAAPRARFRRMPKAPRQITDAVADKALLALEVDARGLDALDRRYLTMIADQFRRRAGRHRDDLGGAFRSRATRSRTSSSPT